MSATSTQKQASSSESRLRRSVGPAIVVGLVALFLVVRIPWPCPMATILHVPCPTCGMTRAARCVLHGDLAGATHMHPLWFLVLPAIAFALAAEIRGYLRTGAWGAAMSSRATKPITLVLVALLLVLWIARFFGAFGGPVPVG